LKNKEANREEKMKKLLITIISIVSTAYTTHTMADSWRTPELDATCDAIKERIAAKMDAIKSDPQNKQGVNFFQLDHLQEPLKYINYYLEENACHETIIEELERKKWSANVCISSEKENKHMRFSEQARQKIIHTFTELSQLLDIAITNYNKARENTGILPNAQAALYVELALKAETLYDIYKEFKPLTPIQLERVLFIKDYQSKHPLQHTSLPELLRKIRDYCKEMKLGTETKNKLEYICNTSLGLSMTHKDRAYSVWAIFSEFEMANIDEILWNKSEN
jgi:hypothetical protein